ncbi:NAD(P)-binding domain-containing protein [Christiangramia salexigens]|uniref:Pyridine nucleotide-disulfide oxidoreductase n=1 Tax=Christiangramia salexigens TaxID=1913577 RepID=A0A1L3J693_9FLAO|nr:NAD(P)-binding domain-containing protein [Christiangramia salexigens]APG60651.1 pyridine nucleotide-disulfide oxidoreductase [Christiangramia salexigens]
MDFDVLIIGGGAAGISCALVIGSALDKPYAEGKKAGIILHQKASPLNSALLNNVFGIPPGTKGSQILKEGVTHLKEIYPELRVISKEKLNEVSEIDGGFQVITSKRIYTASKIVIATGYTSPFRIKGLEDYVIPHKKAKSSKNRIQLKNTDHLVKPGLYVAGTLAGWRSQYSIASGSGAAVATDILTEWNDGNHTKVHDKLV